VCFNAGSAANAAVVDYACKVTNEPTPRAWTTALALGLLMALPAGADAAEAQAHDTCAQAMTAAPTAIETQFTTRSYHDVRDIDFFTFKAEPGLPLEALHEGEDDLDAILGLFDSQCRLLAWNDWDPADMPYPDQPRARLVFRVPADGRFILAATSTPDFGFVGDSYYQAAHYYLSILRPPAYRMLSGQVSSSRGGGLAGVGPPYAHVELYSCDVGNLAYPICDWPVVTVIPDPEGRFEILTGDWDTSFVITDGMTGEILAEHELGGNYLLQGWAFDGRYEPHAVGPIHMGRREQRVVNLYLSPAPPYLSRNFGQPRPVEFGDVFPCEGLPADGGRCEYSVEVHNRSPHRIQGMAWSIVEATGTGSALGYATFTVQQRGPATLRELSSALLRFSFPVPAEVARGAVLCTDAWIGDRHDSLTGSLAQSELFCIQKREDGYVVLER
jgi:hypothetical protein